jgi:hypothetical protein
MALYNINEVVLLRPEPGEAENVEVRITAIVNDTAEGADEDEYEGVMINGELTYFRNEDVSLPPAGIPLPQETPNITNLPDNDTSDFFTHVGNMFTPQPRSTPTRDLERIIIGTRVVRIDDSENPSITWDVTVENYIPRSNHTRFVRFKLRNSDEELVLLPTLTTLSSIVFIDDHGREWVNSHQVSRILLPNYRSHTLSDIPLGVRWMLRSTLQLLDTRELSTLLVKSEKKKKKLRHKYGKMPVIKEEKNYVGKDYIA